MFRKRSQEASYRLALTEAIWDNRKAIYDSLVASPTTALDAQLAEFLLSEAKWPIAAFLRSCIMEGFGE